MADRASWLAQRRQGIGASEAAAILGLSPFKSALEVYLDKAGLVPDSEDNEFLEWGRRLEPIILGAYADKTGRKVTPNAAQKLLALAEHPFVTATLDADVVDDKLGMGVLEAKTTNAFRGDEWAESIPAHYQVQLQHQMLVTGRSWGSAAVLIGGNCFRYADLPRHEAFIQEVLLPALAEFWQRVLDRDPPEPDSSKSAMRALAALYPKDTGEIIELDGSFIDLDTERQQLLGRIKELQREKDELDARLKGALKDASMGVLPNGVRFTYRTAARKGYIVEDSECRVLRRMKAKGGNE